MEENLKKLEVKRLHDRLMKQADEEVGREKEFAMLTAVVQERETEIDIVRKQVRATHCSVYFKKYFFIKIFENKFRQTL